MTVDWKLLLRNLANHIAGNSKWFQLHSTLAISAFDMKRNMGKKLLVAWVEICPLPKKYYQLWLLPMFTNSAIFDSIVRVKTNPGLLWSCSNLLCDWSKKYRATLSTNPMQNKHQSKFGRPRFPALYTVFSVLLWVLIGSSRYFPLLIGQCNYFGFRFKTLNRKALQLISGHLTKSLAERNCNRRI